MKWQHVLMAVGRVEKITGVAIDLDDAFRSWSDVVVWGAP